MRAYRPAMTRGVMLLLFAALSGAVSNAQDTLAHKNFTPNGSVLVQVFGYSKLDASEDTRQSLSFGCTRAHLGYAYKFTPTISATLILDAAGRTTSIANIVVRDSTGNTMQTSTTGSEGSYYTAFLKFAFIEWRPDQDLRLQLGGVPQNHYITQEKFWGYRYVYETFQDRYYKTASGDWGGIGYWQLNEYIGLDAALTNGDGIRGNQDPYGSIKYAAGIDIKPLRGLITRLYYDNLDSGDSLRSATLNVMSMFVGYDVDGLFRVGIDLNYQRNNGNLEAHDLYGYSLFAAASLGSNVECFARFDDVISNMPEGAVQAWHLAQDGRAFILGCQYQPATTVRLALNYQGWSTAEERSVMRHFLILNTEFRL